MEFRQDNLQGAEIAAFLQEHLEDMYASSPPESVHALNITKLRQRNITFWTAWEKDTLIGCGALKTLSPAHAELKSMRITKHQRRNGAGSQLLMHLINEAKKSGYQKLSLETGSVGFFEPARKLYEKFGFIYCGPFGEYQQDPFSVFMQLELKL